MAKRTNYDLQNTTQKTKYWPIQTPLKTRGELKCSGMVGSSSSTSGTRHVTLGTNPTISHEWGKDREVLTTSYYLNESSNMMAWYNVTAIQRIENK
jgi:hypothetical protein